MKRIILSYEGVKDYTLPTNASRFLQALSHFSDSVPQERRIMFGVGTQDLDAPWSLGGIIQCIQGFNQFICDIINGYQYIVHSYVPGDEIFLFGYSRGAFTARVLANFIARFGILPIQDTVYLYRALRAYKDGHLDDFASKFRILSGNREDEWVDGAGVYKVPIEVVGCWDTVANFGTAPWHLGTNPSGVPEEYRHFDAGLVKGIKRAFHALALDECRGSFTPMLWHLPQDVDVDHSIVLRQCWFPGTHSNIGGACADSESALSNLSLAWMIDQCSGLLEFDSLRLDHIVALDHDPTLIRHLEDEPSINDFDYHYQGWGRGMCYDSYRHGHTWTWKYRTPGAYQGGGETRETIHASVRERWDSSREPGRGLTTGPPVYEPMALKGFELRKDGDSDRWEWVRQLNGKTDLAIPQFPFPNKEVGESQSSLEWRLRYENNN